MSTGPGHFSQSEADRSFDTQNDPDSVDWIQLALRNKLRLILSGILGLLIGHTAYTASGPLYQARAKILVSTRGSVLDESQEAKTHSGERREHLALMMSPVIVDRAIQLGKLDQLPTLRDSKNPSGDVLENLVVKRSAGQDQSVLNVLDVSYTAAAARDARAVVAAVIDAYDSFLEKSHRDSTREMIELIAKANDDISGQLATAQANYLEFCKHAPFLWMNPSGETSSEITDMHQGRILVLEQERHKLAVQKTELESRQVLLKRARQADLTASTLNTIVTRYRILDLGARIEQDTTATRTARDTQLLPLLMKEGELLKNYGEDHPEIQSIRQRIQTIRSFYIDRGLDDPGQQSSSETNDSSKDAGEYLKYLEHQIAEINQREQQLDAQLQEEMTTAKSVAVFYAQNQAFQEQIQHLKSLRQVIANRAKTSNLEKDNAGYRMQRMTPVQDQVVFKRHLMFLGGGTALSLLLTFAATWRSATQDTVIRSIDVLARQVNLPILGGVPLVRQPTADSADRTLRIAPELGFYHRPNSPEAEAYRSLRTALSKQTNAIPAPVIQITSPERGDGKTLVTANLGLAIAQTGQRVLLIDSDLRSPGLHQLLGIQHGVGLTDVLLGEIEQEHAVQSTGIANLSVIVAGMAPDQPAELLAAPRLTQTLDWARTQFDCVLLDTSPLLMVSDPCVIGGEADGVLMVIRIGKSCRAAVARAQELLALYGLNSLGILANGFDLSQQPQYGFATAVPSDHRTDNTSVAEQSRGPTPGVLVHES